MVELDKKDIEGIANRRFFQRHIWHIYLPFFGWLGIAYGILKALEGIIPEGFSMELLGIAVAVCIPIIVGILLWQRAETKVVKAFVEECEENPMLSYVGEPSKDSIRQTIP